MLTDEIVNKLLDLLGRVKENSTYCFIHILLEKYIPEPKISQQLSRVRRLKIHNIIQ